MIGEIPINVACYSMDKHDTETRWYGMYRKVLYLYGPCKVA